MKAFIVLLYLGLLGVNGASSPGTIKTCDKQNKCSWNSFFKSKPVSSDEILEEICMKFSHSNCSKGQLHHLYKHQQFIIDVYNAAGSLNHELSYEVGLSQIHLDQVWDHGSALKLVQDDLASSNQPQRNIRKLEDSSSLNWCDGTQGANPKNKNICTTVKSQQQCGSCWAFAAADTIETASAIGSNEAPISLSTQQFLDCSKDSMSVNFKYCWLNSGKQGVSWLSSDMNWRSRNDGCDGGMTHLAFNYAMNSPKGVVSELELPYTEATGNSPGQCNLNSLNATATIKGWEQAVGVDCSKSTDMNVLLRYALQNGPISVAISSQGNFKNYKSGIYKCPNNGNLINHSEIDHAITLVGYGVDPTDGEYWILKNSYGPAWGESGFMRIKADNYVNCGISVYPVVVTGAAYGPASSDGIQIDNGGKEYEFIGISYTIWIIVGAAVCGATVIFVVIGFIYNRKMRARDAYVGGIQ